MTGTSALLVIVSSQFTFNVYARMRDGLAAKGWTLLMVTALPSVQIRARRLGIPCTLLRRASNEQTRPGLKPECAIECVRKLTGLRQAREHQNAVWDAAERMCAQHPVRATSVWNGQMLGEQALAAFARDRKLPTLFLELGNIEQKLFIDAEGIGGSARVAKHPELLDRYNVTDAEIDYWSNAFLERRKTAPPLPQALHLRSLNPFIFNRAWLFVDRASIFVNRTPQPYNDTLAGRARLIWNQARRPIIPDIAPSKPYVFLPLQVSIDSSLLLFSKIDNLKAIEIAAERAGARNALLVIKAHPAERDTKLLRHIIALCAKHGHLMTDHNTTALVRGAEEVVTINSTVGLEARVFGIPLTILGECLYANFTQRQAAAYIIRHLAPFRPYGHEPASPAVIEQLLSHIAPPA